MISENEYEAAKDALASLELDIKNVLNILPTNIDGEYFGKSDVVIMRACVKEAIEECAFEIVSGFERQIREYEISDKLNRMRELRTV